MHPFKGDDRQSYDEHIDNPMYRKISDDMLSKIGIATITKLPW